MKDNRIKILGISSFYHDAAATIIFDDEIIAAVQEERFTRKKNTKDFPVNAIKFCLEKSNCKIADLDAIVFYEKPKKKFDRLIETYTSIGPKSFKQYLFSLKSIANSKTNIGATIISKLLEIEDFDKKKIKLLFSDHHLSHAASSFYTSNFQNAAILTIDGVGEWSTATISKGEGNKINLLREMSFPHSVGLLYSGFTQFLGFKVNSGEYKLMGLAPYGNIHSDKTKEFIKKIKENLVSINNDGSIWLNQKYFKYLTGFSTINKRKWENLFCLKAIHGDQMFQQDYCNLALAIQCVTDEIVIKMATTAKQITGCENICLSGGVALNCVSNGKLHEENIFKNIYIQPAAGDAGSSLGAAFAAYHIYFNRERIEINNPDLMKGSYLGPDFSNDEVESCLIVNNAVFEKYNSIENLCNKVAALLQDGNVIGWFQGRMEFGPRALGNRSIIADPRNSEMQKKLNLKIKFREGFRPFAPAVLEEDANLYFETNSKSPYMLLITQVKKHILKKLPFNYDRLDIWEKLYHPRSEIQTVTHVDLSARIQTVSKKTNYQFWNLLSCFKKLTGCSVLVNTSFNVRGEPIVCSPEDAYKCFMMTDMDYLIVNNFLLKKTDQPNFGNKGNWYTKFEAD